MTESVHRQRLYGRIVDLELWSRPCQKCGMRIDKCVCPGGPTICGAAQARKVNDPVALPNPHYKGGRR